MRAAALAIVEGLRRVCRSWGLCVLLLGVNLAMALLLAVPLAGTLEASLHERPAGAAMMRGFDYPWWSHWSGTQTGWPKTLGPDLLGRGFGLKNLDLLLKGQLPAGLFAVPDAEGKRARLLDPLLLGIGAAYMLVQVFLAGGVLSVLRQAQGRWTVRGMLHGAGFYCGRFLRVWALMMIATGILFALYGPLARFMDGQAREAVSESTGQAWLMGRHVGLLIALVFLHVIGTYARVIVVLEERSSAALAVLSGLSFALTHVLATAAVAGALALLFVLALNLWQAFDLGWATMGYKSQILTLLAMQAFVLWRIALRVALAASLMDLYRRHAGGGAPLAERA